MYENFWYEKLCMKKVRLPRNFLDRDLTAAPICVIIIVFTCEKYLKFHKELDYFAAKNLTKCSG